MSYADVLSRISDLESLIQQVDSRPSTVTSQTGAASFKALLAAAGPTAAAPAGGALGLTTPIGTAAPAPGAPADGATGALRVAESQIGVTEQPPGSNDGAQIAAYRSAVAGAYPGAPWCAYFVSWCAAQAGTPIGDGGRGLGSVAEITDWAQRTGRLTQQPAAGDLILFGTRHVGIVESVNPDGSLTTVEGNTTDGVARRHHWPSEATGFVRM